MPVRRLDRRRDHARGGVRKCREDPARMEPARAFSAEDRLPIHVLGGQLGRRRVGPVRASDRRAHAKAALREVQAVADRAADPVVRGPADVRAIHTALSDEVFDQPADRVVCEGRHDGGRRAEAATQATGDVVFAAAFPRPELTGALDPLVTRIQAQHHFAQCHQVPTRVRRRTHGHCHQAAGARTVRTTSLASWASRPTAAQSRSRSSAGRTIQLPPTATTDRTWRYASRSAASIPPVGTKRSAGNGPPNARRYAGPPADEAGKSFTTDRPRSIAWITSVGVKTPGRTGVPPP